MEVMARLYLQDEIDDVIYGNLLEFVSSMDFSKPTEADQWLKLFLLDARYGRLMLEPGDLLENIRKALNDHSPAGEEYIIQKMLDGGIGKIKFMDGSYYTIQFDHEKGLQYLVRICDNVMTPLDFDVADFRINRPAGRIEYTYTRGNKKVMSLDPEAGDKKELDRTLLYPEEA